MPITATDESGVTVLRMACRRGNAIGRDFVAELDRLLSELERGPRQPLVLVGTGRIFCVGLDLLEAYENETSQMAQFVDDFDDLFLELFQWPAPVVAAINGHAVAGGAILAMACDHRVMTSDPKASLGLNEVRLGIPFPPAAREIARHATPSAHRGQVLLEGRTFSPEEARAAGLVHDVAPDGAVLDGALAWARSVREIPAGAWGPLKGELRADAVRRATEDRADGRRRWLDAWFAPAARERIGALCARLAAKGA
jgi:enoyl-CoA hydratase